MKTSKDYFIRLGVISTVILILIGLHYVDRANPVTTFIEERKGISFYVLLAIVAAVLLSRGLKKKREEDSSQV